MSVHPGEAILVRTLIEPQSKNNGAVTGGGVDCREAEFNYALVVVSLGANDNAVSVELQHSDDDGDTDAYASVVNDGVDPTPIAEFAADVENTVALASLDLRGCKRWLRLVATVDNHTGSLISGVLALTAAHRMPVDQTVTIIHEASAAL